MYIKVVRYGDDMLSEREWTFMILAEHSTFIVRLCQYEERSRPSKRHKVKLTAKYDRLNMRDCSIKKPPPVPPDVVADAHRQILASIVFDINKDL
jgi:hypothetical protein